MEGLDTYLEIIFTGARDIRLMTCLNADNVYRKLIK